MSEWVPVEERLPERGQWVLVYGRTRGDMSVLQIPEYVDGHHAGDDGKSWYPGGWGVGWTSHWMPLPEPPQ